MTNKSFSCELGLLDTGKAKKKPKLDRTRHPKLQLLGPFGVGTLEEDLLTEQR